MEHGKHTSRMEHSRTLDPFRCFHLLTWNKRKRHIRRDIGKYSSYDRNAIDRGRLRTKPNQLSPARILQGTSSRGALLSLARCNTGRNHCATSDLHLLDAIFAFEAEYTECRRRKRINVDRSFATRSSSRCYITRSAIREYYATSGALQATRTINIERWIVV